MLESAAQELPQSLRVSSGFDHRRDIISDEYLAGPFLIYDCQNKHWVCVLEEHFENCQDMREEDIRSEKVYSRCAPVGEFPVKFSCFQEQLRLVSNVDPSRLCLLEQWKGREIRFD